MAQAWSTRLAAGTSAPPPPCGVCSHFLIVLRDRLVSLEISLIDLPSRIRMPRILPIKAMVITSVPCHKSKQVRLFTLVNIRSASTELMPHRWKPAG
jgi:hypothetical protein